MGILKQFVSNQTCLGFVYNDYLFKKYKGSGSDFDAVKDLFFDSMTEAKEGVRTSNSRSSAYMNTVEGELRSKSKRLVEQGLDD